MRRARHREFLGHFTAALPRARARGFSLLEVLVALVIIAVGMLGLAKIQFMAYATTGTASQRSLAAIEAASLAAAMHANRNYWSAVPQNLTIAVSATAVNPTNDANLAAAVAGNPDCLLGGAGPLPCTAVNLAADDLLGWSRDLKKALPNPAGTVSCNVPLLTVPVSCTIQVSWTEEQTGINAQSQGNSMLPTPYTLYVVP